MVAWKDDFIAGFPQHWWMAIGGCISWCHVMLVMKHHPSFTMAIINSSGGLCTLSAPDYCVCLTPVQMLPHDPLPLFVSPESSPHFQRDRGTRTPINARNVRSPAKTIGKQSIQMTPFSIFYYLTLNQARNCGMLKIDISHYDTWMRFLNFFFKKKYMLEKNYKLF